MIHSALHFFHKVWHRMFAHSHEIAVAMMIEMGKAPLIMILLIGAAVLVLFALQVAFGFPVEE